MGQQRFGVGGVDVGCEVGHVQGHRGDVEIVYRGRPQREFPLDLGQVGLGDRLHGVPEAAVVEHAGRDLGEPVGGGGGPPVGEGGLRAWGDHPVERGQRQVGADAGARARQPPAGDLVDEVGDAEAGQHAPHRGHVTESQMAGTLRQRGCLPGGHGRGDVLGRAQVALADHFWLALDAAHLPQVVVRLPVDLLGIEAGHL